MDGSTGRNTGVTPVFKGNNLVAEGVLIEARLVEDSRINKFDADIFLIALGTNDVYYMFKSSAKAIADRLRKMFTEVVEPPKPGSLKTRKK